MHRFLKSSRYLVALTIAFHCLCFSEDKIDAALWKRALEIHKRAVVIDTHCDTPMVMTEDKQDIALRNPHLRVDLVKMKEGGVDAEFFAVFVPNDSDQHQPRRQALQVIDEIYNQVDAHPDLAAIARSPADILALKARDRRAILIGMENGGIIEGSLALLHKFFSLGVRYITLTHNGNNDICDSATAGKSRWNGLSPFGHKLVRAMNRLGMIIDVSHISDKAFWDVLAVSKAPVMASHSSVRALCPAARNMSDDMIKALAAQGGVIQINLFSAFLDPAINREMERITPLIEPELKQLHRKFSRNKTGYINSAMRLWSKYLSTQPEIEVLMRHIDHVVRLVGPNHVGIGSDYDGASSYPHGLEDISGFPRITYCLLKRGYSEENIMKILGGNFLRLFKQVERLAEK